MDRDRYQRLKACFRAALALRAHERGAFLAESCAGDAELRTEVEELLAQADARDTVGAAPPVPAAGSAHVAIQGFELRERIAAGASSVVFRAEQLSPRREVAVKLLRHDALGPGQLSRFQREAEIVAGLQHPGIAPVFGTGVSSGGGEPLPWIAMELVRGDNIDLHVSRSRLPTDAILELMRDVCDAVAHAHRRGIVHRDLKPSNVMVDESGRVRVLDFGVARLLARSSLATEDRTRTGSLVGTLAYMAPEQARGDNEHVDARADVYALGHLLFELLTGRSPLDLQDRSVLDAVRAICDDEPQRLSHVRPSLAGDLDAIVGKCLEKSPARRYRDAGELAAELDDFLARRPVRAQPPTITYQLGMFVARNRALSFSTVAIVLALAAGLALALRGLRAERVQRERTNETLDFFAGKFLALSHQLGFGPEQRADLEDVELRIRRQMEVDPDSLALNAALADTLYELASQDQTNGNFPRQRARVEEARRVRERILAERPDDVESWTQLSMLEAKLGEALRDLGDLAGRDAHFARALEIDRRLVREHPDDLELAEDLGWSISRIASVAGERGDHATEEALITERLADADRIAALEPDNWKFAFGLSHAHYYTAAMHVRRGALEQGLHHAALNVLHARRAFSLDPTRRALAAWLSDSLRVTAGFHATAGDLAAAATHAEDALSAAEFVVLGDPLRSDHVAIVHRSALDFAQYELARKRFDSALRGALVLRRVAPVVERSGKRDAALMLLSAAADIEARCAAR